MKGLIFDIRRYSVHDGPGIRVTIFLKGCPLNCAWCHNPEGISSSIQQVNIIRKVGNNIFNETKQTGKYYTVKDLLKVIERERVFIDKSGGGVTFSGGEPLLQHDFLLAALKACNKEGLHTAVDTSGFAAEETFRSLLPFTDLFMFDLKHLNDDKHLILTGKPNGLILANYKFLVSHSKSMFIRIPVIPGINDEPGELENLRNFIMQTRTGKIKKICLLPYHKTGSAKYRNLGIEYRTGGIQVPSVARMRELQSFFSETGIKVKIGG